MADLVLEVIFKARKTVNPTAATTGIRKVLKFIVSRTKRHPMTSHLRGYFENLI